MTYRSVRSQLKSFIFHLVEGGQSENKAMKHQKKIPKDNFLLRKHFEMSFRSLMNWQMWITWKNGHRYYAQMSFRLLFAIIRNNRRDQPASHPRTIFRADSRCACRSLSGTFSQTIHHRATANNNSKVSNILFGVLKKRKTAIPSCLTHFTFVSSPINWQHF